jgi:UDP-4-amino-4,6-dideoxy-L-N-acetyl-beta-L-altrosamine transaminase
MKKFINYRKKIYDLYKKLFDKSDFISFPIYNSKNLSSYHLVIVNFNFKKYSSKENLLKYLFKNKINAQFHYKPLYKFTVCDNKKKLPFSEQYYNQTISIPIYYNLKLFEVMKVTKVIKKFLKKLMIKNKKTQAHLIA